MAKKKKPREPNEKYTLKRPHTETIKRVLALDPGTKHMGISCVGIDKKDRAIVLANAVLTNPIWKLTDGYTSLYEKFIEEVDRWVKLYKPDAIVIERFMTRGGGGSMGGTIECIGVMIGILTERYNMPIKMLNAATWKNAFHRKFYMNSKEGFNLRVMYKICATPPHQLDSILIGCYGLEIGLRKSIVYTPDSIMNQAATTSRTKIINRKPKV